MYEQHFNLDQPPFSIAPDPSFLYLSSAHREALAHLMYGFSHGGFVMVTGEVGTGKTTLLRNVVKQTPPDLTVLSKNNGGVYPQDKVYAWIRDPQRIRAHGTEEMPVWGDRYSKEIIEKYGPDYYGPGSSVQQRILELVFYLGTIQE